MDLYQLSLSLVSLIWSGILGRIPIWKNKEGDPIPDQIKETRLSKGYQIGMEFGFWLT